MYQESNQTYFEDFHSALMRLFRAHRRRTHTELHKIGISQGQPRILNYLKINDGCIQRELADHCHIEPATVTSILTSMEKSGLIYRVQNSKDKRILNVFITEKGKDYQQKIEAVFFSIDEVCLKGFSEEEKLQTINFLNRFYDNLLSEESENA
ncbi:MarR family winged helix-turn-helix transcriptional regulator [Alkaliphilus crotonatoxidans]|jgi:DNA-binding MarR family transcriptional regulator